jgi:cation diffusion facilitator family transporter
MKNPSEGAYKLKALKISVIAIFSVVVVEIVVGLIINSLAILSDGLHALLDVLSSVLLFFAVRTSLKPPDEEHTYGHEKFEAIGGLIGGLFLFGVAFFIFYEAGIRLIENIPVETGLEFVGFIAIGYALFVATLRVTVFRRARHMASTSMKAGFYDAISDFGSTIIALIGFGLATLGFHGSDAFASILLGIMLTYLSFRLVRCSIMELSDTASKETVKDIKKIILSHNSIVRSENLKVRKVGSKIFIEAAIQVASIMSLEEAHALTSKIEADLKYFLGNVDATLHIEPLPKEEKLERLVEKLATVQGVREVHEISTIYAGDKLFITLHACVNPDLSVEEAHKIAEDIERKLHSEIKSLENVTVHMEPSGMSLARAEVNEEEFKRIISDVAHSVAGVEGNLRIKRIVTYLSDEKRYINMDCCFTNKVQIKDAHRIASQVEKETKDRFVNAVVTVHIEPECI